jgi:hypothetical protein
MVGRRSLRELVAPYEKSERSNGKRIARSVLQGEVMR